MHSHLIFHLSSFLGPSTRAAVFYPGCSLPFMCYQRKSVPQQPPSKIAVDLAAIDARLQQLTQMAKKSSLHVEFETFLTSLPSVRSIYSATPEDVSRFLVWKDRHGKKVVHVADCLNASNQNASDCGCPK